MSDPYFSSVAMLLHCNGTNGSTTFIDNSSYARTMTAVGNASISTAQSKFGGASGYFDGTGDYLTTPSTAQFQLGSSDFTIESFVRFAGWPADNAGVFSEDIICKAISTDPEFYFYVNGTASSITSLQFIGFSSDTVNQTITVSHSFSLNTWYHVAVSRVGNLLYLFVDGILKNPGGTSFTTTIQATSQQVSVGRILWDATYRYELNGYLDELRLTKGVGRYTSDFSIPTEEYPDANYSYSSLGGMILGGSSSFDNNYTGIHSELSVGGMIVGGLSASTKGSVNSSSGGMILGGPLSWTRGKSYSSVGGMILGGEVTFSFRPALLQTHNTSGGMVLGGATSATFNMSRSYISTGGHILGGETGITVNRIHVSSGGMVMGGTTGIGETAVVPSIPVRKLKAEYRKFIFSAEVQR